MGHSSIDSPPNKPGFYKTALGSLCPSEKCSYYFTLPLPKESVNCPGCKNEITISGQVLLLKWCEEQYALGFKMMDENRPDKAIQILCKAIDVFHRISCPPHQETHKAQERLQLCFAFFGNVSETLVKCSQSEITEAKS